MWNTASFSLAHLTLLTKHLLCVDGDLPALELLGGCNLARRLLGLADMLGVLYGFGRWIPRHLQGVHVSWEHTVTK